MAKQRRKRGTAGDKTICLPLADDLDYATLVADREAFRQYLDQQIAAHPELFPTGIEAGYRFHGWVESSRQQIKTRRILLPRTKEAYQLRPDFVMPYMSETAEIADKAGVSSVWGKGQSEMLAPKEKGHQSGHWPKPA
jgi:hypothetical protein